MAETKKEDLSSLVEKALRNSDKVENEPEAKAQEESITLTNILEESLTFEKLGVCSEICEAVAKMGYKHPSKIQAESLPYTLQNRDIIGLAETGSGKTAAFAIPVIQKLLENPQPYFCLVMSPTRELCV